MARDSVVVERVWFPRFAQTQTLVPKGIGWRGVSCWAGVFPAEELLLWLLLQRSWARESELTAGKSGMEGPGEGLQRCGGWAEEEALRIRAEGRPYREQGERCCRDPFNSV